MFRFLLGEYGIVQKADKWFRQTASVEIIYGYLTLALVMWNVLGAVHILLVAGCV